MESVITSPDEITPQWLTDTLRNAGSLVDGWVESLDIRLFHPHGDMPFSTIICHLTVHYSPQVPESQPRKLLVKIASPALLLGIPGIGRQEVTFYNTIANHIEQLPVVRCYQAVYSDEQDRFHILMDDLSETYIALPPMQMPPPDHHCEMIVDALAQMHAFWWDHPWLESKIDDFLTEQEIDSSIPSIEQTYRNCAAFLGSRLSERRRALFEQALTGLPALMKQRFLGRKHMTVVFEDVHAGNFLYPRDPSRHKLKMIDWEQWHIDIGPHDLAYMMALFWFPERRARLELPLLRRYHDGLVAGGVQGYTWDDCWWDYRLSIARMIFDPTWQWERDRPPDIWWNHLERITSAYEDLNCGELFT